jgi:hypothetical protein
MAKTMAHLTLPLVGAYSSVQAGETKAAVEKMKGETKAATEEVKGESKALVEEAKGNKGKAEMERAKGTANEMKAKTE